jgi:hypothetical protein
MSQITEIQLKAESAANLVRDAGGQVSGRTRLQKTAYLLELAGFGVGFEFEYRSYGPYSEELATATEAANLLGVVTEEERITSWGGSFFVFTATGGGTDGCESRVALAQAAATAHAVELELAATAAFLYREGEEDPWAQTAKRKPDKAAGGRLARAQRLYEELRLMQTPEVLPTLPGLIR